MALVCAVALYGCGSDDTTIVAPAATLGSLNVTVNPGSAETVVTGPGGYTKNFTGSQTLADLAPGQYTAVSTATGFTNGTSTTNVVAGVTSSIEVALAALPTLGSLNVNVNPAAATVLVTGPGGYTKTFNGNQFLTDLAPGQYTVAATAPGFADATTQINVVAGETANIPSLVLQPTSIVASAPRAVYRVGQELVPITLADVQAGKLSFYAWVWDQAAGISTTAMLANTITGNPGQPLLIEQTETAPSFTQNLAAGWIGYTDATGVVRPVIGGDVRWTIDQFWTEKINSVLFGTSDDNRTALDFGIDNNQADTRTNNAKVLNQRFPLIASQYPLFNLTGIGTADVDGFTWVTLFSPDKRASARIVAVATVNGEEIGKQILFKNFAPQPKLQITKTVQAPIVNLAGGTAGNTWTIKVTNVGEGDATAIALVDTLASGAGASYTLGAAPAGSTMDAGSDGFTFSIPSLPGGSSASVSYTPTATVTAAGVYCNNAHIASYVDSIGAPVAVAETDLNAQACFTALSSNVSIVKDFVAADNMTSLGKNITVAANVPVTLRVQVINNGTGAATGVNVSDTLDGGAVAPYTLAVVSPATATANANDGFDNAVGSLAAGVSSTMLLTVTGSADGTYCDTATVTATSGTIGIGSSSACLTVATPSLTIAKTNAPAIVMPGASYTSTIAVTNTGTATATAASIQDTLGLDSVAGTRAIYVSSSLNGQSGTVANNELTASSVDIPAGATMTFTVVSQIPPGAASGNYCNTATVTSSNTATKVTPSVCVAVPAFVALQTQLVDLNDPVAVGSNVTYSSVMYVEAQSNEGVKNQVLTYSFGLASPTGIGTAGLFQLQSTRVYLESAPVRDPVTGLVLSDSSSPTARLLVEGTDYTLDNTTAGLQVITMAANVVLQPNTALYAVHVARVPTGTAANKLYTSSYIWRSTGLVSTTLYEASSSEPTTVLP